MHWKMILKFLNNSLPSYSSEQWQNIKHSMFNKATNHCWLTLLHQHHLVAAKTDAPKCALCSISCTLKNVKWLPDPVIAVSFNFGGARPYVIQILFIHHHLRRRHLTPRCHRLVVVDFLTRVQLFRAAKAWLPWVSLQTVQVITGLLRLAKVKGILSIGYQVLGIIMMVVDPKNVFENPLH